MSVSLEKIDMLMERANITYKEAKDALEAHNGDMVEALISLESSQKTTQAKRVKVHAQGARRSHQAPKNDFFEDMGNFFKKMHKTSFIIGKKGHKVLDLPLTIAALITLFTLPFSIFLLILPYFFGYSIIILDEKGKKVKFEEAFNCAEKDSTNESEDRRS